MTVTWFFVKAERQFGSFDSALTHFGDCGVVNKRETPWPLPIRSLHIR
jgi:hypothetical protein